MFSIYLFLSFHLFLLFFSFFHLKHPSSFCIHSSFIYTSYTHTSSPPNTPSFLPYHTHHTPPPSPPFSSTTLLTYSYLFHHHHHHLPPPSPPPPTYPLLPGPLQAKGVMLNSLHQSPSLSASLLSSPSLPFPGPPHVLSGST